ncbi:MAG: phage holin family protein [Solobacterium sp.]|nr:phage holin family protein [Solobacterium sp.]
MGKFIRVWIVNTVSLWVIDYFSSYVQFSDLMAVAATALALTLLNMTIKPILKVISLPLTFLTFGLFSFVINGFVLWASFQLSNGSTISSFGAAIVISIILTVLNGLFNKIFQND